MTCKLSAIVAVCDDWGIGCEGDMVVSNRADMRHFVACTKGCPVIMGRKTLLSFPGGRPLKNRRNIVLTRDESFAPEGVDVVHSIDEALAAVADEPVAWVIGGGDVYWQFLPYCVEAEVTHNHCDLDADSAWEVARCEGVATIAAGEGDEGLDYEFVTYRRVEA